MTATRLKAIFTFVLVQYSIAIQINSALGDARRILSLISDLGQKNEAKSRVPAVHVHGNRTTRDNPIAEVISKHFTEWNITIGQLGPGPSAGALASRIDHERDLVAQLNHVIDVAGKLVRISHGCEHSNGNGTLVARCPHPAPELLQGGALAFLSSLLRTYPRGPTSLQALVDWTADVTTFLQEHQRKQRQQRIAAQSMAEEAADVAVFLSSERATAAAAAAAAAAEWNATKKKGDDAHGIVERMPSGAKGTGAGCIGGSGSSGISSGDGCSSDSGGGNTGDSTEAYTATGLPSRRALTTATAPASSPSGNSSNSSSKGAPGAGGGAGRDGRDDGEGVISSHSGYEDGNEDDAAAGNDGDWGSIDSGSDDFSDDDDATEDISTMPAISTNITGVQYGGLPIVRRFLLAQLLLGWMNGIRQGVRGLSSVIEEELARLVTLMYEIHVESVAQRAMMEYFHISKAGGTSWTAAAGLSGCQKPRVNAARVRDLDDDCRWINGTLLRDLGIKVHRATTGQVCSRFDIVERHTHIRDCVGRLRHSLRRRYQYISNEYTLHGGLHSMYDTHICPQFVNVISIREPLSRLVSNVKYMLVRLRATLFRKQPGPELFRQIFCNASASIWELYSPPVADNYNIRTLVGERAFHTPLYGIGEAHEAVAKQLLLQYDLVLDLNSGDVASDLVMREGLGWQKTLAEVRVWTIERLVKKAGLDLDAECTLGDLAPLLVRQVYDQRWYSFGRTLSRLDQLFLSAAAHLGMKPWPQDWVQKAWGPEAGAAASADEELQGRCGLLGATQALRQVGN